MREQRDYVAAVRAAPGARAKLETYAAALAERFPSVVPLAESLRVAADRDPACRAVLEGLDERRATNMRRFAAELRATGEVRRDLTDEQVAHLLWATNSPAFYRSRPAGAAARVTTPPWCSTSGPAPSSPEAAPASGRWAGPRTSSSTSGPAHVRVQPRPSPARHVRGYCGHLRDLTAITPHVRGR